jgi:hypothetical protein
MVFGSSRATGGKDWDAGRAIGSADVEEMKTVAIVALLV